MRISHLLERISTTLNSLADKMEGGGKAAPSFADEFEHPQLKTIAKALETDRLSMPPEEYQRQQQVIRDIRDGKITDVDVARDALRGRPLTTEERNEQARQQFCQELDDRNTMIEQIIISSLGPHWRLLPPQDIDRLELEMRHGGEERYGGESAEVQMSKLKAKLADILKQRGPSSAGVRQPERGSAGEEGSDWLENSGFWHKR